MYLKIKVTMVQDHTSWALLALDLELGNLAGVVDVEVLKKGLGSLLVLVLYLLGLGVDLLLPLLLSSAKLHHDVDGSLYTFGKLLHPNHL